MNGVTMRIAVTADVHLSPGEDHPERLNALADKALEDVRLGRSTEM